MEPKFQSSFIPKGPAASSGSATPAPSKGRSILGVIATAIFSIALLASLGVFGYNYYLGSSITQTGAELDKARAQMDVEAVNELIYLDNRIMATEEILNNHNVVSPLFRFLEDSTLQSVRLVELSYSTSKKGAEIRIDGQARSYTSVALQAEEFKKSSYFNNLVFSDLTLDEDGNVVFSLRASVDPQLISYKRLAEREVLSPEPEPLIELEGETVDTEAETEVDTEI